MLEWRGYFLWYGNKLLADVCRFGRRDVRLDLRGWDGFGVCDFPYPTMSKAKAAGEAWARSRGIYLADAAERAAGYGDEYGIADDDIPF